VEYVVAHEIAHLAEHNHGPRFWALVERAIPDYKKRRQALRKFIL
jgi:predicted metal-dependent hydrolase